MRVMTGAPSLLTICALSLSLLMDKGCGQVYPWLQWFPNNPIFMTNVTDCVPEMKVLPNSKINVMCPTTVTILETVQSPKPKHELYENLWIIYDNKSFEKCDANTTNAEPPQKANKRLMKCDKPLALKYYTIVFREFSAISGGLEFKPGTNYYFLATSDGTQGSLDSNSGGHCNDTQQGVAMKFKIYVCKNENDSKCADETYETFGTLKCPSRPTKNPSSTATTTATTATTTVSVTTEPGSKISTTEPDARAPKTAAWTGDERKTDIFMSLFFVTLFLLILVVCAVIYQYRKYKVCIMPCQSHSSDPELGQNANLATNECALTNSGYRSSTCSMDVPDGKIPDQQFKNMNKENPLNNGVKKKAPTKPTELKEKLPNNNIPNEVNVTDEMV